MTKRKQPEEKKHASKGPIERAANDDRYGANGVSQQGQASRDGATDQPVGSAASGPDSSNREQSGTGEVGVPNPGTATPDAEPLIGDPNPGQAPDQQRGAAYVPNPDQRTVGLFQKYRVSRMDGTDRPGGKHEGAAYFVIDMADPFAAAALKAYADACKGSYPLLAADLYRWSGVNVGRQ